MARSTQAPGRSLSPSLSKDVARKRTLSAYLQASYFRRCCESMPNVRLPFRIRLRLRRTSDFDELPVMNNDCHRIICAKNGERCLQCISRDRADTADFFRISKEPDESLESVARLLSTKNSPLIQPFLGSYTSFCKLHTSFSLLVYFLGQKAFSYFKVAVYNNKAPDDDSGADQGWAKSVKYVNKNL